MDLPPFVSVIVPVRNEERLLAECLESLVNQDYSKGRLEIIVVDNDSTDLSRKIIHRYPVRYLFQKKRGAAAARNTGARTAEGDWLAFTDSDCIVPPDWISRLVAASHRESADAFGGDYAIASRQHSLIKDYLIYRGFYSQKEFFAPAYPFPPWLLTGNLMVRRETFEKVGGFEETLLPGEDVDFSWRIGYAGGSLKYLPDLKVQEQRPPSFIHFYRKNFHAGKSSFLLSRRHNEILFRAGRVPFRERLWKFLQKLKDRFFGTVLADRQPAVHRRGIFFLLICSGHLAFQAGRILSWIRFEVLKKPCPVPRLPKKDGPARPAFFRLPPGDRLLYLASLPERNCFGKEVLSSLIGCVDDWQGVLLKAASHGLLPRLYFFLIENDLTTLLKGNLWRTIQFRHRWLQAYILTLEGELRLLLPVFERAGVDILLLKGAALLQTVFRERPIRSLIDLDLMIRPEDFATVRLLLEERGYRLNSPSWPLPSQWHEQVLGLQKHRTSFPFLHEKKRFWLDLHTAAFEPCSPSSLHAEWLWEDVEMVSIGGSKAFLPEPNRLFVHLLLHLCKHASGGQNVLARYLDLDACLRYLEGRIDGDKCWEFIRKSPFAPKILEIFAFIEEHFTSPLPKTWKSLLQQKRVKPLPLEDLFDPPKKSDLAAFCQADWIDRRELFLSLWKGVPGVQKRILFLWKWLFPDPSYLEAKYRCRTFLEKGTAYARHWTVMMLKGVSLGLYLVGKGKASSWSLISRIRSRGIIISFLDVANRFSKR